MKEELKKYKNNTLSASDTEGVEKKMLDALGDREQRQKWNALLAAEGIERSNAKASEKPSGARTVSMWRYAVGLAASILLVAVVWQTMGTSRLSSSQLADNFIKNEHFESPSVRMGSSDDIKNWADAKNAYRDGNFEKAAQDIEAIPNPNTEQKFYLGLSYLYQKQAAFDKAAPYFKAVMDEKGNFKDEARWFYAISLIKMDKKAEAKAILEEILRGGAWKSKEAKELIEAF